MRGGLPICIVGSVVLFYYRVLIAAALVFWGWTNPPSSYSPKIQCSRYFFSFSKNQRIRFHTDMKLDAATTKRLKDRPYYAYLYARNIVKGRLPESIEKVLVNDPRSAYLYAKHVMKGKLPDFVHNGLILSSFENSDDQSFVKLYIEQLTFKD